MLKRAPNEVVKFNFDVQPVCLRTCPSFMYISNCVDEVTGETSLIKFNKDTLQCTEIYQSKFKIIHMAS